MACGFFAFYLLALCIFFSSSSFDFNRVNCFRHLRNFGLIAADTTAWWKAGIGLALATAFGFLVVKVIR